MRMMNNEVDSEASKMSGRGMKRPAATPGFSARHLFDSLWRFVKEAPRASAHDNFPTLYGAVKDSYFNHERDPSSILGRANKSGNAAAAEEEAPSR